MDKCRINAAAHRAAKKVRESMDEFSKETGMSAEMYLSWLSIHELGSTAPRMILDRVEVQPVFPPVAA
jgi:hypothetical protein